MRATREALGETLIELVRDGHDIAVVEADLSKSTTTAKFASAFPERFYNVGIAEQNMIGTAAGLAVGGKVSFTGSFAVFATGRAYDQIRNTVCYSDLNVKLTPTHSGVTVGPDGGSHQMLEDIALMRALPGMRVLVPADHASAVGAIWAAACNPGPFYVRLGRAAVPAIYEADHRFEVGRAHVLREGSDVTIAACGVMVAKALEAAEILAADGVSAQVVDVATVKPLDAETIVACARKTRAVLTCEEHSVIGGLGSAVAELLAEEFPVRMKRIGIPDVFGTSGQPDELIEYFGLEARSVADVAKSLCSLQGDRYC